tara:strand:- start:1003 stop:1125 length:123 start_codon:yes stop_codon:yes gene_type:complete
MMTGYSLATIFDIGKHARQFLPGNMQLDVSPDTHQNHWDD